MEVESLFLARCPGRVESDKSDKTYFLDIKAMQ